MIRWQYKTLHFALKKDGILGSPFLDVEELERDLCRYGQDGWELVTVLDVEDGLVALCKQACSEGTPVKPTPLLETSLGTDSDSEPAGQAAGAKTVVRRGAKTAANPPKPERPAEPLPSLFGDDEEEDEAPLVGPSIDTDGDEEGGGLSSIKIE